MIIFTLNEADNDDNWREMLLLDYFEDKHLVDI